MPPPFLSVSHIPYLYPLLSTSLADSLTVNDNKKSLSKYINSKRQSQKKTPGPVQDEDGHLMNMDRDKAEVFNGFFASVFNTDDGLRGSQCPELEDHGSENDKCPASPKLMSNLMFQMYPYKSIGLDGIHPKILKELDDVTTRLLSMIFERSWESSS
ncbi:hypothetical protein BTVI_151276 [Pitangus sulphuratus]|nr:hypothetical protein BTVI_151276 [Pitangus sulphuratus]